MNKRNKILSILVVVILSLSLAGCWAMPIGDIAEYLGQWGANKEASPTAPSLPSVEKPGAAAPTATPPAQSSTQPVSGNEMSLPELYVQANPSVVNISVVVRIESDSLGLYGLPNLFGQDQPDLYQEGQGSGFVYDDQGHIITNYHVVENATEVTVIFADDTMEKAEVVGTDPDSDLAVIKVDNLPADAKPLPIAADNSLRVGDAVVAIGNPYGLAGTMTSGIVSALGRMLSAPRSTAGANYSIPDIVQTDAAINPGNSGGPLLNLQGEVVGVNAAIESTDGSSSGVGFAIPARLLRRVVPALIDKGSYEHPWLGISTTNLTPAYNEVLGLPEGQRGVLVISITEDSPAARAGLRGSDRTTTIDGEEIPVGGDVIVGIDQITVNKFDDLITYLSYETEVGDTVTLSILRDGETVSLPVTLAARPR